jgi:hypothetical protein
MGFDRIFHAAATFASPPNLDDFRKRLDPVWVDAALAATGTATLRRRRLPAEQVIWVVLGMALFRDRTIEDVVSKLDLALPGGGGTVAKSSVSQARNRLGSEPVKWLFEHTAKTWATRSADAHRWRGLTIYGIDGTTLRVPDSSENRATFGGQSGRNDSESGYPMLRLVALMVLRSHLVAACSVVGYGVAGERRAAEPLLAAIPDHSLTIVDRGFFSAAFLLDIEGGQERHWLSRARSVQAYRVVKRFARGDELIEVDVRREARRLRPDLPRTMQMRAITYKRKGFKEQKLLTSLRDPKRFPVSEIAEMYHERWDIELGYDEIKTEMLDREETIRSRKPDGVLQEVWGILLAYNLVRLEMESIAKQARIEPTRISFIEALRLIRDEWEWLSVASPGAIPKRLETLRRNLKRYVLPPRRPRRFPREVKIKMSNYDRKRPVAERAK